jgi:hypothetical protein
MTLIALTNVRKELEFLHAFGVEALRDAYSISPEAVEVGVHLLMIAVNLIDTDFFFTVSKHTRECLLLLLKPVQLISKELVRVQIFIQAVVVGNLFLVAVHANIFLLVTVSWNAHNHLFKRQLLVLASRQSVFHSIDLFDQPIYLLLVHLLILTQTG